MRRSRHSKPLLQQEVGDDGFERSSIALRQACPLGEPLERVVAELDKREELLIDERCARDWAATARDDRYAWLRETLGLEVTCGHHMNCTTTRGQNTARPTGRGL
jgi:hypothetical protein